MEKRIRSGKELMEAKQILEDNERKWFVNLKSLPVRSVAKSEHMRECLRSLRRNHKDRVGRLIGGIEFLELCGFERTEAGEFL
ncbi:hypothetical protein RchiOBHm_Chr6g0284401 [Rosa chinensis]|uniref:Uncharacterized protein n=1 Tax=Rosa chinensis TaxID=74649 RepID=A0A2P6PUA6_ROSCH|nr:hypothetical protein RchiOBHm_Chr6g0284401 [Rosa chinensis]